MDESGIEITHTTILRKVEHHTPEKGGIVMRLPFKSRPASTSPFPERDTISNAAKVDNDSSSLIWQWRCDDEEVAGSTFELIEKNYRKLKNKKPSFKNICVHKGMTTGPPDPLGGHLGHLLKATKD
jgi:hypothetical protein